MNNLNNLYKKNLVTLHAQKLKRNFTLASPIFLHSQLSQSEERLNDRFLEKHVVQQGGGVSRELMKVLSAIQEKQKLLFPRVRQTRNKETDLLFLEHIQLRGVHLRNQSQNPISNPLSKKPLLKITKIMKTETQASRKAAPM